MSEITPSHLKTPAALVTGGAIRLGKTMALALARHGFDIALHYHSSNTEAQETAMEIRNLGVVCGLFEQDLNDAHALPAFMAHVQAAFSNLNLLVNSASGYTQASIMQTDIPTFDEQLSLNLRAPFFLTQAFAQQCKKGHIINILDNKIAFNQYQYAAYLLSKKALTELTTMSAMEFAPSIRVNGIDPGVILPAESSAPQYIAWRVQGIPLKTQGHPQHVTRALIYLLENDFVTGQIMVVDGGESNTQVGLNMASYSPEINAGS